MDFRHSSDSGHLLENLVCLHLRRKGYELEFVRTHKGREVDFLARHAVSGDTLLVQVCYDLNKDDTDITDRDFRSLGIMNPQSVSSV